MFLYIQTIVRIFKSETSTNGLSQMNDLKTENWQAIETTLKSAGPYFMILETVQKELAEFPKKRADGIVGDFL